MTTLKLGDPTGFATCTAPHHGVVPHVALERARAEVLGRSVVEKEPPRDGLEA